MPTPSQPNQALPTVSALYRYPVKGLTAESLDQAVLSAGGTIPFDRAYAIENGSARFDPDAPQHLPKIIFLMLMRDERLATLRSRFDDASHVLTILRDGRQVARGDLTTKIGRQMIEQFLGAYMKAELRGAPRIVSAPGHSFSNVPDRCLHIVNLASLREFERTAGRAIDPLRFRANLYFDGLPPWAEFGWIGKVVCIGGVRLSVARRTRRCAATDVDPTTGARDMALPAIISRTWGHSDFGVYATVATAGTIARGDTVTIG